MDNRYIVIFDGVCVFCNGVVNFIINRDPESVFSFSPMQSEVAQSLIEKHGASTEILNTLMLIKNGKCYLRTDAILEIAKDISGFWYFFNIFKIIPRPLRDFLYTIFARNRYNLFGKRNSCMVPTENVRNRFIGL
ncbi:MAG: thiol-disulfide oxidoreductase DCC family protein [Desulforhopalus sp.]